MRKDLIIAFVLLAFYLIGCNQKNIRTTSHDDYYEKIISDHSIGSYYLMISIDDKRKLIIPNTILYESFGRSKKMSYEEYDDEILSKLKSQEHLQLSDSNLMTLSRFILSDSVYCENLNNIDSIKQNNFLYKKEKKQFFQKIIISDIESLILARWCFENHLYIYRDDLTGYLVFTK